MNGGKCSNGSVDCEAPIGVSVTTVCFHCGRFVCRKCSQLQPWRGWTKKRICTLCNKGEK